MMELLDLVFNRMKDISRIRGMGMVDAFIKHYIDNNKLVDKIKAKLKSFNPKLVPDFNISGEDASYQNNINMVLNNFSPEKCKDNLEFFNKFIKDHIDPADFVKTLNKYQTDGKSETSKDGVENG